MAACAEDVPAGASASTSRPNSCAATQAGVVVHAGERLADVEGAAVAGCNERWSSSANRVPASYFPESRPEASGTRTMMPTPASLAAGNTSSSGLSRKALAMICTVATCGCAIAASASSTFSTLTPYDATAPSATKVSSAS